MFGAPTDRRWPSAYARWAAVGAIILGIGLRVLFLDADPHYYEWIGYITDEGRWTDAARQLALFGRVVPPVWSLHVVVAPLFQLMNYVVFALGDVSVLSSRLISAIAGSLVPVAFWIAFRRTTTPEALFLGIVPLALQIDLVALSRLAVPEMTSMALQFLLYLTITSRHLSSLSYFSIGLFSLLVVAMKVSAAPVVAIFSLLLIFRQLGSPSNAERRWVGFFVYIAGLVGPLLILALVLLARRPDLLGVIHSFRTVQTFLGASGLRDVLSFPLESPLSSELNLWGLAFWYALIGWQAARSAGIDTKSHRHFLTAATWCVLYVGIMLVSSYFPDRYKVHILVPMCITTAVGVGLLQRAGVMHAESAFAETRGLRRLVGLAFLSLPTATFVSPLLAQAVGIFGVEPFRLRTKVVTLAASVIVVTFFLEWNRRRQRRLTFFMLFPVVAAFTWFVAQRSGLSDATFWPTEEAPLPLSSIALLLAAAALSVAGTVRARRRTVLVSLPAGIALSATGYALLALVQLAPGYLSPHYSIRDASRQLGTLLAGFSGTVATSGGDGLFRENTLRYRTLWGQQWPSDNPGEVVVIVFPFADPEDRLATEYCRIGEYPLYVASEYYRANPTISRTSSLGETVSVYRKRITPHCPNLANR
jgi:hypothetical protein